MTVKFWGRVDGVRVMRLTNDTTNDLVDLYGADDYEIRESDLYNALRDLGYGFGGSWTHIEPARTDSGAAS